MATAPERVRRALLKVTGAAQAEIRSVAAAAPPDPAGWRAAMFATAPLIVSEYASGASVLGTDWFEEIRDDASPKRLYTPTPRLNVTDEDVAASVARATSKLHNPSRGFDEVVQQLIDEAEALTAAEVQKQVASGFWDTITENADDDPDAVGWQRFARPGACKFCLMLADRGAVYTRTSVNFAAHTTCHCVAGQSYDAGAPRASVMQYVASRRKRSDVDKARLRDYLNENFPDAPG